MNFEQHKTNLCDWMYYGQVESGLERMASVLLLGEKEELDPFAKMLRKRVGMVSEKLDDNVYDYVIIPRLTARVLRLFKGDPLGALRSLAETWLNPGGKILLAVENQNAIDLLASDTYEEGICYFSRERLEELRQEFHKLYPQSEDMVYYPYPDLTMPLNFYSDDRLPKLGEEDESCDRLVQADTFPNFAPAFLYVLKPEPGEQLLKGYRSFIPVYIRYNSSRLPEYAIKTEILRDDNGKLHVLKESLDRRANTHIETIAKNAQMLENTDGLPALVPEALYRGTLSGNSLSAVQYPYVNGKSLAEILADLIQEGKAPVRELQEALELVIGQWDIRPEEGTSAFVNPVNLDGLFSNVLMDGEMPTLIDCEWVVREDTEIRFLAYRNLKYWYEEYKGELSDGFEDFVGLFGFDKDDIQHYEELERNFQLSVHGEGAAHNIYAYKSSRPDLRNIVQLKKELVIQDGKLRYLRREENDRAVAIGALREKHRLSNVHVGNLNNVIAIHERDIVTLQEEIAFYKGHQSLSSRIREQAEAHFDKLFPEGSRKRKALGYFLDTLRHPIRMLKMFFTKEGRNLIEGDMAIGREYLDHGMVKLPYAEQPKVSVVIPCYNQVIYTYRCLLSIVENTDPALTSYEVIIADDVSTDATKEIQKFAENIVVARNAENQGFLKNCNQAAARARGEYIFFLNNDTTVEPGWLSSLVEMMDGDDSIGMCGSKLLYPDGRLQEAGGIIWSDASGWNYGRLQDPELPEYNYVKEVDYISGAAIMIRRSLWEEIGGFDERFAPAYYEDSDLAFEVRRHGKRVVFQPESRVVHYEGISNGTDVNGTGLKRYQQVNLSKFQEKWKDELRKQDVNTGSPNPFRARERGQGKKYILVVDHYVPTWDKDAGSKTTFQYLQLFLQKGYRVKFLPDNFLKMEPYTSSLCQMGIEVLYGPVISSGIWKWIEENRQMIDIVYFNRPDITNHYIDYIRSHTGWKRIFYGHDLHFLREYREYQLTGNEDKLLQSQKWQELEFSVMQKTDMNYYPSVEEIEAIHRLNEEVPAKAITAYIFTDDAEVEGDFEKREGLLFVGGFGHPPNKDGILWFANEILPLIQKELPDIRLYIAGSKADEEVMALSERQGIEVLGFVSDERLHELYQESRIVVAPLRFGAGVKGKVVEAMHEGAVIVTTGCGAEGIPLQPSGGEAGAAGSILNIADTADGFAGAVLRLYKDTEELSQISLRARDFVRQHYSMDHAWSVIEGDFQTLT